MSNIYLFFKLKRPYLELFKFTAFFPKGPTGLRGDSCQLIEIFNDIEQGKLIKQNITKKTCQLIDRSYIV
ncbi:hypothetical protein C1637_02940 [Chryseobacterium lactis]|uniref:Uncharacterized protein n=1 Tax=Chryseobacterium lactis TaxID=1241981 RepID=A0A3G6RNT5_CHRLC|nr:hypothetical protein EG342_06335 [Chryseobacterium lactis]AZB06542.1 hypothetical protein EG341_22455 [Chryseobacterium lactis]PNW15393.1 hypothetical protein C1637_02940 [Chryseobacterium lactis]